MHPYPPIADAGSQAPPPFSTADPVRQFMDMHRFWHDWIGRCSYRGRWQQMVNRAAITLKLLTYAPTGGPVAAATMCLPEQEGGERNWDYRYTCVGDASLSVRAMRDLGFTDEVDGFRRWLQRRLQDGGAPNGEPAWMRSAGVLDWLCDTWDRPDEGIWETRGGRKDFTYSRLMCWVAFDRGVRQAVATARPADLNRWTAARDAIMEQITTHPTGEQLGNLPQAFTYLAVITAALALDTELDQASRRAQ
ncbi:glycoside hydrolase family 15 protein [Streptomyces sp. NPDC099050]|uniref:glycoside hydrolase family 15 protein n=1 Tax=Streptomyces sp. NPDC099050 TaxID=3366100 RepID=UPI003801D876